MLNILSLTLMALSIALSSQNKPKARKLLAGREQRIFEEQRMDEERILNDTQPKWRLLAKKDSWSSYYRKVREFASIPMTSKQTIHFAVLCFYHAKAIITDIELISNHVITIKQTKCTKIINRITTATV